MDGGKGARVGEDLVEVVDGIVVGWQLDQKGSVRGGRGADGYRSPTTLTLLQSPT